MPPSSTMIKGQHWRIMFAFRMDAACSRMSLASIDASAVCTFGVDGSIWTECTGNLDVNLKVLGGGTGVVDGMA